MGDSQSARERGAQPFVAAPSADMRTLEINGSEWRSRRDFYDALSELLGGIERDCRSSESLLETMIFHLDRNAEQPPYELVIRNPPDQFKPYLWDFASSVAQARQVRSTRWGDDVAVVVRVD